MTYKVADGFNVPDDGSMTVLSPQPSSAGVQYGSQRWAADGTPINEAPFGVMVWSVLGTKAQFQAVLTAFVLLNATSNEVTVTLRNENFDFVRYNGRAIKPLPENGVSWERPFPRNITILVRDLVLAS